MSLVNHPKSSELSASGSAFGTYVVWLSASLFVFDKANFVQDPMSSVLINWVSYYSSTVIWIAAFILLSASLSPALSALILSGTISLLGVASYRKQLETGEPLLFGDISHLNHLSLALKYVKQEYLWLAAILIAFIAAYSGFILIKKCRRSIAPLVLLASLCAMPLVITFALPKAHYIGLKYLAWDWRHNAKSNGLMMHLLQTSQRPSPIEPTLEQKSKLAPYIEQAVPSPSSAPSHFIMVLCESCWHDGALFADEFEPFRKAGAIEFRGVSPVYGGGTVNATLEMLTGLPTVNSAVMGIIYQEYRDYFSDKTVTLPSLLADSGFATFSAHNHYGGFWFRNVIEPKLGFNDFFGREEMSIPEEEAGEPFVRDKVLFNFAHNRMSELPPERKAFIHLATVYSHGPYPNESGDGGHDAYRAKVRPVIADITDFVTELRQRYPKAVVLVYGDHKPALPSITASLSDSGHQRGNVPIWLIDPDKPRATAFVNDVADKPLWCFTSEVSEFYYGFSMPSGRFTDEVCKTYSPDKYESASSSVPSWVYGAMLFDKRPLEAGL